MTDSRQLPLFAPVSVGDLTAKTPLSAAIAVFQNHLQRQGKSAHTINAFTSDLQLLTSFSGEEMSLGSYTTTYLNKFLHWLEFERGVPCSRKSYARRVTTLKVFFKWLHTSEVISIDPALALLQRSGQAPLQQILSPDDVDTVLLAAAQIRRAEKPDTRPEFLFRLLLETGMKKGEAMRLTPDDILRGKTPLVVVRHKNARNVYQERKLEVSELWLRLYGEYALQYMPQTTVFTCTARNLEYILEDLGTAAGLDLKISFEMMRWTSAVRAYERGDDPDAIRERLGLSRISWVETLSKIRRLASVDPKQ